MLIDAPSPRFAATVKRVEGSPLVVDPVVIAGGRGYVFRNDRFHEVAGHACLTCLGCAGVINHIAPVKDAVGVQGGDVQDQLAGIIQFESN
jgi:hypothetical protein